MAMLRALAVALMPVAFCWQLTSHRPATPSGMLAFAALVLAGLALALLAHGARTFAAVTTRPLASRACALQEKSRAAVFQRQLNPDADGHSRPRAPGAVLAAARPAGPAL